MKNIYTILSDMGITIPEDKRAEFDKSVAENYKTIADYEKKVTRLTEDRDSEKKRADEAVATLQGFDGKDFDAIQRDRDDWKKKYDDAVAAHQKELENREFNDSLSAAIKEAKGKSDKAIIALLDVEKLRASRNQQSDIKSALDALRSESGYLFEDNGGTPYFASGKSGNPTPGKKYTMGEIMKMKNENPNLDIKQLMNIGGNE